MAEKTFKTPTIESVVWPALFESMPRLEGKVIAITGCTTGTGFCAAVGAAKKGAQVVMLNRKSERASAALAKVQAEGKAEHIDCDLQEFASVRAAGEVLRSKYPDGIDVLACNAGVMAFDDYSAKDGFDVQMQTNHLSHFLLVKEIYGLLEKRSEATGDVRIVSMSSGARKGPPLEEKYFEKGQAGNLGGNGAGWGGPNFNRYHMTKLANCVFTYEMKRRLEAKGSKIKMLLTEPGLAATELASNLVEDAGGDNKEEMAGQIGALMSKAQSAEDGAAGLFICMADPAAQSGEFYGPEGATGPAVKREPEDILTDEAQGTLLWDKSVAAVGGDIFA